MVKNLLLILIFLTLTLIFFLFFACTLIYMPLPKYNGILNAKRNSKYSNITIYRDEFGIPHIKADTFKAGLYGSGVVNA